MAELPCILSCNEVWRESSDDPDDAEFDHRAVIFRLGEKYFHARDYRRTGDIDLHAVNSEEIPLAHFRAPFDVRYTRASTALTYDSRIYLKEPSLITYGQCSSSEKTAFFQPQLQEVEVYEILRQYPHPNVGVYHGCAVEDGRIRGLYLQKYNKTLAQLHKENSLSDDDRKGYLEDTRRGIKHLHDHHLVHGDINPTNIMVDYDGNRVVIIDFDSCRAEGEALGIKAGTPDWSFPGFPETAEKKQDIFALRRLHTYLLKGREMEAAIPDDPCIPVVDTIEGRQQTSEAI